MKRFLTLSLLIGLAVLGMSCSSQDQRTTIAISATADPLEVLAAREVRRYWYLTTGELARIEAVSDPVRETSGRVFLCTSGTPFALTLERKFGLAENPGGLGEQGFQIASPESTEALVVRGASHLGTLYGAYRLIEELGVRFYPDGDVIPDQTLGRVLPRLNLTETPAFRLRGIQPFHDFPEGPDWWNLDDYKSIVAQLAKMRLNFIGFHTYPSKPFTGTARAEPMVWVGLEDQVADDGQVRSAYPVLHFHTGDESWGYDPVPTSEFHFGGALLFDRDMHGADYMRDLSPWPHRESENLRIFNDFGRLQREVFGFARRIGVGTCVGTETPVVIPEPVNVELRRRGVDPESEEATRLVYRGIFSRIRKTHPLDFYWFWTPESWTWEEVPDEEVARTRRDLMIAEEVARELEVPFRLATSGWVLGPPKNRAEFDEVLPKAIAFSCINREVGFSPVDEGFARAEGRSKWAIPWLEDDPALVSPQLWVGRVRRDARDALRYGCDGLLGIHWRTRPLSPAFGALARAGWDAGRQEEKAAPSERDLSSEEFYQDWAGAHFGPEAGPAAARIFSGLDGGPLYVPGSGPRRANLFRTSDWAGMGPGGVLVNPEPWAEVEPRFAFIEELEALAPKVNGAGNRERFGYWLETFRYARQMAKVGCTLGELRQLVREAEGEADQDRRRVRAEQEILPLRNRAAREWGEMVTLLLQTVSTTGGMGTVANLEQHNLANLRRLSEHDEAIELMLGRPLPPLELPAGYQGVDRLFLVTRRGILERGEELRITATVLSGLPPREVTLHWRPLGDGKYRTEGMARAAEGRGVYRVVLEAENFGEADFEYFVEATLEDSVLRYPPTAPSRNQTVVIW